MVEYRLLSVFLWGSFTLVMKCNSLTPSMLYYYSNNRMSSRCNILNKYLQCTEMPLLTLPVKICYVWLSVILCAPRFQTFHRYFVRRERGEERGEGANACLHCYSQQANYKKLCPNAVAGLEGVYWTVFFFCFLCSFTCDFVMNTV